MAMNKNKPMLYLTLITEIGINMVLSIVLFMMLGMFCDQKFNSKGICTIIGIVLGVLGGFYNSYKAILDIDKKLGIK